MKKVNVEKKATNKMIEAIVNDETLSKSTTMKKLFDIGLEVKEISNLLNVRYNFVYNVVSNYCRVNKIETVTNKKEGKKEKIIALFLEGKSNKEISIELQTNYNYVFNTLKIYKKQQEEANKKEGTNN